jgi:hypothetical protein
MQVVSTATTIALTKVDSEPTISLETLKAASSFVKGTLNDLKAKFDKNGNIDKMIQIISGPALWNNLGEQNLLQVQEVNANLLVQGDRVLFFASITLLLATLLRVAPWQKLADKIGKGTAEKPSTFAKAQPTLKKVGSFLITFVFLVAAALFFHGFMCILDYFLDNGVTDIRTTGPIILRLIASAFFTLQPMTSLLSLNHESPGIDWSNFVGILLFHLGNVISLFFALQGFSFKSTEGYFKNNFRTFSLLLFTLATALLLTASVGDKLGLTERKTPIGDMGTVYNIIGDVLLVAGSTFFWFA